ncbi:VWA domain-containing protein [uncultured Desulfosarcina sp.]|uniref:pilus assembly protein n=1 Tax=uncultured Desulfosarcina sp. TaxID=218289 RepID=UPI0029C804BA|nr:VWA domain-containing protein [uncultured Desulfosarcina sp.]
MKKTAYILILAIIAAGLTVSPLQADDTDIYGGGSVSVEPNVLIIFDTSGSMDTKDVPGDYYDPATTYSGTYTNDAVYIWSRTWVCDWYWWGTCWGGHYESSYSLFASDVSSLVCSDVKNDLLTEGTTTGRILDSSGGYECGGTDKTLYMGNWLNYDASSDGDMRTRTDVAKEVITNLIQNTDGVRFGLMRFNNNQGGRVVKAIQSVTGDDTYRQELIDAVNALPADGMTPLSETLAEAGLYYAGMNSWFNSYSSYSDDILTSSSTYTSPMQYRCQKNYIILMTDGSPTSDNDSKLATGSYINGDKIGDYDNDNNSGDTTSDASSDFLDDVAKYLYDNDCNPSLGSSGDSFEKQNIITYTIGFQSDQQLLQDAATNGGGEYYVANSISGLSEAFEAIISKIMEVNAVFVSPVVPVSRMNRAYAGNSLYVGFFKPQNSGRWVGNVKKYGLNSSGAILDADKLEATTDDGQIKDNARSYWSATADGQDVTAGGVGELLLDRTGESLTDSRKLYTYLGSATDLTDTSNAFSTGNTALTETILGVASTQRDSIIEDIIGDSLDWKMGDILHSQPSVVHYDFDSDGDVDESYIFVGTNGGVMHAFTDSDGEEAWGFIPQDQLGSLQVLSDSDTTHDYFVDGAPAVYEGSTSKILFFGARRGGYRYHALDVTDPEKPLYKYNVVQGILTTIDTDGNGTVDGSDANLGQSWTSPTVHTIKTGTSSTATEEVFLLAGGYDTNQDLDTPATADTMGRAVYTIDVTDGSVSALNFNAANFSGMNNCFTDAMGFDSNGDGFSNRVYAGDLAGNMWAFEDDDATPLDSNYGGDGNWSGRKLFSAGAVDSVQRKIFYAPDVTAEYGEDMIFFGTGDRADPEETGVVNRIYAIRNDWEDSSTFSTLTENDLVDVTDNLIQMGTQDEQDNAKAALDSSRGWYFELEDTGEKIISNVVVYAGVLYFTTYTPESSATTTTATDPCTSISGRGTARLYAVDYLTGAAVKDYSSETETDGDGNTVTYGKKDRSKVIGTSIASSPVIAVLAGGAKLYIGVEGGIQEEDPIEEISMHKFYWRRSSN